MNISEEGKSLIKKFEGCKLEAYLDAVNVPTIAYGRTKNVKMGDVCTQEQAEAWLDEELHEYEGYVKDQVNVDLEQYQFDALVSWVYNLGPTNLNKLTDNGTRGIEEISDTMLEYIYADGKKQDGLVKRRQAEYDLFNDL